MAPSRAATSIVKGKSFLGEDDFQGERDGGDADVAMVCSYQIEAPGDGAGGLPYFSLREDARRFLREPNSMMK